MQDLTPTADADFEQNYESNFDGALKYLVDLSLAYKEEIVNAETQLKKDYYTKKLGKNNRKMYKMLMQTPNSFNPLMEYMQAKHEQLSILQAGKEISDQLVADAIEGLEATDKPE